jgi:hypothetical protein
MEWLFTCVYVCVVLYNEMWWKRYWKIKVWDTLIPCYDKSRMIGQWLKCEIIEYWRETSL